MGRKHLKKLRAEESKVHLKKNKLPKGQNVTDTTFKVKKILLAEQLKKANEGEPVSNWNVPIKELLIHLNHYNLTSRLNGLHGIKEVLANYPEILQGPCLRSVVSRLLDLLTDEEHKIRVTSMDLLLYLFDMVPMSSILPFQDLLCVHLGRAMTHRYMSVQWDALNFIDVMIKHAPDAIRLNFGSMAQNFIRILKKFFNEPHRMPVGGSKRDHEKSKVEMFSRFYKFMAVGFSDFTRVKQYSGSSITITSSDGKKISLRESNDQYKLVPDLSSLFLNLENKNAALNDKNKAEFQLVCSLIMPLVFETWMEYCPTQRHSETIFECVLNEMTATLLCVLLKIIMSLYERSLALEDEKLGCWFVAAYSSTFKKCFISGFPYLATVSTIKSYLSRSDPDLPSPCSNSCILQNLIICYLSFSFKLALQNNDLEARLESYMSWVLIRNMSTQTETEMLIKIAKIVGKTSGHEYANLILGKVIDSYDETQGAEVQRELLKARQR